MSDTTATNAAAATAAPAASKKQKILRIVGSIAAIAVIYFVYDFIFYINTDNAQIQANTVILTARVSGFVTKVNVEEGQKVKAGDVLVELDAKDYQSRASQSQYDVASVQAKAHDAGLSYQRIQKLFEQGAVSLQQRDSALATYQELSRKQKALEAQEDVSKNGVTDTLIRAPSDGIIARKSAEVGMLANPGAPLIGFVSSSSRWVVANFKETDLHRLKIGQKVKVSVDAISDRDFQGEVENFYPSTGAVFSLLPPDNATGNFTKVVQRVPVRIKLDQITPEDVDLLKAGLSVEVAVRVH